MPRDDFQPVIGLEVHAQLLTTSKLFTAASTAFGGAPNHHVQAYCIALPGMLPVLNEKAVSLAIRAGLALECTVQPRSEWSRKHYFYPDLPKGYQITQFEHPICTNGYVEIERQGAPFRVRLQRIHIEEDAGKSVHDAVDGLSLVDLNRAGTPLLELVSEPDLRSADEAVEYLKNLREILMYVGVNDGNLDEGSFRCDANVSMMRRGATTFGTRCELKNLNSFRFIKQAIEYEIDRHVEVIEAGQRIEQETRLFDSQRGETRSMRSKEDARDYRYFPEPDLPWLEVTQAEIARERSLMPELPHAKRRRYVEVLRLSAYDAGVLTADRNFAELFEKCVALGADPKRTANWFMGELSRLLNEHQTTVRSLSFTAEQLVQLIAEVDRGTISNTGGKEVLAVMFETGADPAKIIAERGLAQVSDRAEIERLVDEAIASSPKNVEQYRAGKKQIAGFFVGQVMKAMQGKGNPKTISEVVAQKLG